jgi:uncharacterized protein (TIGR02186 family)
MAEPRSSCCVVPPAGALLAAIIAAFALFADIASARAAAQSGIEVGASENHVFIEPNFAGTRVTIFGAIDGAQHRPSPGATYDIAITVRGPSEELTIWQKAPVAGIWVNRRGVTFSQVPSFYRVISTKPLDSLVPEEERKAHGLGIDAIKLDPSPKDAASMPPLIVATYKEAAIRLKQERGLYTEKAGEIDFLGDHLFRARAELPAFVPPGLYRVGVFLIEKGKVASASASYIRIQKIGIERFLSTMAQEEPLLYGLGAVLLAAMLGGLSSVILRRR